MIKLEDLVSKLESKISDYEFINPSISKGSVGWHIEHSLLTLNLIIDALSKSNPNDYKRRFDIRRSIVIFLGKIPRGRVKAPAVVQPTANFNPDTLQQHIFISREKIKTLEHLSQGHFFTHPFLGDFKLKQAVKFLKVHTKHHLDIIYDIVKSKK
jgi:hypothetical protein